MALSYINLFIALFFIGSLYLFVRLIQESYFAKPIYVGTKPKVITFGSCCIALLLYIAANAVVVQLSDAIPLQAYLQLNDLQYFILDYSLANLFGAIFILVYVKCQLPHFRAVILGPKIPLRQNYQIIKKTIMVAIACVSITLLISFLIKFIFLIPTVGSEALIFVQESLSFPWLILLLIVNFSFFVPIVEELLFRGFLQNWLVQKWGYSSGILTTSFIFAFFHLSNHLAGANLTIFIVTYFMSLVIGHVYEKERSLLAPIVVHITNNFVWSFYTLYTIYF